MPSPFMSEVMGLGAAVDAVFAKPFTLVPMTKAADRNAPAVPDPSRPSVTILGIHLSPMAKPVITNAYDARTDLRPGAAASHETIRITPAAQAASPGFTRVTTDDLLIDVATGIRWRVSSAPSTTTGVIDCAVTLVG